MAEFELALEVVLEHEGGYAGDADDLGGETYRGISGAHHPDWPGWGRVDRARRDKGFPHALDGDAALAKQVREFYREHYWQRMRGDEIPDQHIANEVLDTGVNMGLRRAVRFLQEAINLLDRKPPEQGLTVDGWLGAKTLKALRRHLKRDESNEFVMRLLNILKGHRYVEILRQKPGQERFARGWLKRFRL